MRKLAFLLLIGMALPAFAAKRVSIEQLEQLLADAHGKSDAKVVDRLTGLELTERATPARLARWEAAFPGRHTRQALVALADVSAFLSLPAADIPALPAPDLAEQRRILSLAKDYVREVSPNLPNFLATRDTTYFEDSPPAQSLNRDLMGGLGMTPYQPLHFAGKSSIAVAYRDGHEVADAATQKRKESEEQSRRTTTSGEFGPILVIVMGDAMRGETFWSHWEQGPAGPQAVFRYSTSEEASHYEVLLPCPSVLEPHHPSYHGEIAVDPTQGSILRITIIADLNLACNAIKANIGVEFGPVEIGGHTYICPLKSVSLAEMPMPPAKPGLLIPIQSLKTTVNDVSFVNYHLFRSEMRILPEDNAQSPGTNP